MPDPILAALIGLPPQVMLLATLAGVVYLFRRDFRERPNVTGALWLPTIWMFISGSRPVSAWLTMLGLSIGTPDASGLEQGSPVDAFVFLTIIVSACWVLSKRHVSLSEIARDNAWICVFIGYCLLTVLWSDYPFVSFKRWIKILGHPLMILILFTEPHFGEALNRLMKRCAYVILPVSICWLKYFPRLGRDFSEFGQTGFCGIAMNKNLLGCDCLVLGLFFFWSILQLLRVEKTSRPRNEFRLLGFLLLMIAYLQFKAHSATAWISMILGAMVMVVLGFRFVKKKAIGAYAVVGIIVLITAQLTFDVFGTVAEFTGHGTTIEGRAQLWHTLLGMVKRPFLGEGFESFWLGPRIANLWTLPEYWWHPTEAHNGYLETYLNLGVVGVALLAILLFATFRKCRGELLTNFEWGRFRMGLFVAIIAYNWTEAAFKALHFAFLAFYLIALSPPKIRSRKPESVYISQEEAVECADAEQRLCG